MLSADDGVHAVAYDAVKIGVAFVAEGFASGDDFVVRFPTLTGRSYRLEESPDLSSASWTTAADNIAGSGGLIQLPMAGALGLTRRFYRVKVLP